MWPIRAAGVDALDVMDRRSVTVSWLQVGMRCAHSRSGKRQCLSVRFWGSCHQHEVHQPPGKAEPCAWEGAHTGTVGEHMLSVLKRGVHGTCPGSTVSGPGEGTSQKCTFKYSLIITIVNSCIFVLHI